MAKTLMVSSASYPWDSVWIQKSLIFTGAWTSIRVYQTNAEICLKDGLQFELFTTSPSGEQEQKLEEELGI